MKLYWRIAGRYYEARARRASKAAIRFKWRAEKFFSRIKGGKQ
ncbi:hypothetical protein [Paracoccus sp. (in: a-proteobacteria)]|nr:hypothetical protein [Paracoccus sp. (in: a-proteobacteria)]